LHICGHFLWHLQSWTKRLWFTRRTRFKNSTST
jgi:hypothetical protein